MTGVSAARRLTALLAVLVALIGCGSLLGTSAAHAATITHASTESLGGRILDRAETKTGDWYSYGSAGPFTFDCSGLVDWAATSIGERNWPRDTFDIARLIGTRFSITRYPQRGDLALWGPVGAPYHVEFVTVWAHTTFGAQQSGTRVGWHDDTWFRPSFYLHVNY